MKFVHDVEKCMDCGTFFSVPVLSSFLLADFDCPCCGSDCSRWLRFGTVHFDNPKTITKIVGVYNEEERRKDE